MEHNDRNAWPTWATAPIAISEADPGWAQAGQSLVVELAVSLSSWLRDGLHHIGSTAVPGLPAKPILDIMAGVRSLDCIEEIASALAPAGWHYVPPELDQRDWRRFLVKVASDTRVAHLHVMNAAHPRWTAQLLFRDRLREHDHLRDEYGDLKRLLSERHAQDREAYTEAKTAFVARVLGREGVDRMKRLRCSVRDKR